VWPPSSSSSAHTLDNAGFPRDNWHNKENNKYLYGSEASTRNKDTYFDSVLSLIVNYWAVSLHRHWSSDSANC